MLPTQPKQNLADYLTVSEAAEFLGVSTWTLRNWDKAGKLKPLRHPKNGYRIYRHEELAAMLEPTQGQHRSFADLSPSLNWNDLRANEHFVQFYDDDAYLVETVASFIQDGLRVGDANIVVAKQGHRNAIHRKLKACGLDLAAARGEGRYVCLDAENTLERLLVGNMLDHEAFQSTVGSLVARMAAKGRHVRAFGEMVAILWQAGNRDAAIQLEELWNELGKSHPFTLFCAYPLGSCGQPGDRESFSTICAKHSRVIPAESYLQLTNPTDRQRAIAELQQKAESLEAELAHRAEVEKVHLKLQEELREQDRLKNEFLATLAHELRNSLAPIRNALDIMKIAECESDVLEARSIMERQTVQMTRLLEDLLDVSRVSRGQIQLRIERFSLDSLMQTAIEMSRPEIESYGHQLHVSAPSRPVMIEGDKARLAQVLANLLNNSAKYTEHGGQIWFTAESANDELVLSVRDNGIGIPSESLATIFEMFKQAHPSLERSQKGLGIGLTLVKRLVELHSGSVSVRSEGPGLGSEFTVRLPVRQQRSETAI